MTAPLHLLDAAVRPEWIDYNGHMNVGYYVVAFDAAADLLMDACGLDEAYRKATGNTIYVVEAHIVYAREMAEGEPYRLSVQVLGVDDKRIHAILFMHRAGDGELAATYESMMLHVGQREGGPGALPFPPEVRALADGLADAHSDLAAPEQAGRVMKLRKADMLRE